MFHRRFLVSAAVLLVSAGFLSGGAYANDEKDDKRDRRDNKEKKGKKPKVLDLSSSIDHWTTEGGQPVTKGWSVSHGVIAFNGKGGSIMTAREFEDFNLRFQFKIVPGGNSGLKYKYKKFGRHWLGCEFQVLDDARHGDGKSGRTSTGSLYHVCAPNKDKRLNPPGEWNRARVVVRGTRLQHYLNGKLIVEIDTTSDEWKKLKAKSKFRKVEGFGENRKGRIMLQDHGSKVWYRNVTVRAPAPAGKTGE